MGWGAFEAAGGGAGLFTYKQIGSMLMNIKHALAGGIMAVGLVLGGGTAAFAGTEYPPEGGTWNYGVTAGVHLYSDYFNQDVCHGSSTRNDWGLSSSPNVAAGVWSNNSQPTTAVQNNRAYYRVC